MLVYLTMTIYSSNRLSKQTEIISEHPFEVVISAGDLEIQVTEMRLRLERFTSHRGETDIRMVEETLSKLYDNVDKTLKRVGDLYLGDAEDVKDLKVTLAELQKEQNACIAFASSEISTVNAIEKYEQKNLYPLYERADKQIT